MLWQFGDLGSRSALCRSSRRPVSTGRRRVASSIHIYILYIGPLYIEGMRPGIRAPCLIDSLAPKTISMYQCLKVLEWRCICCTSPIQGYQCMSLCPRVCPLVPASFVTTRGKYRPYTWSSICRALYIGCIYYIGPYIERCIQSPIYRTHILSYIRR